MVLRRVMTELLGDIQVNAATLGLLLHLVQRMMPLPTAVVNTGTEEAGVVGSILQRLRDVLRCVLPETLRPGDQEILNEEDSRAKELVRWGRCR